MGFINFLICKINRGAEQDLINSDTNVLPNGLQRIREDRSKLNDAVNSNANSNKIQHLELSRFSTESLHSYSFVTSDVSMYENRQNILRRSIDFMKNKIKGWRIPAVLSLVESLPQS